MMHPSDVNGDDEYVPMAEGLEEAMRRHERAQEQHRVMAQIRDGARIQFQETAKIRSKILRWPEDADRVEPIFERCRALHGAEEIGEAIWKFSEEFGVSRDAARREFGAACNRFSWEGRFIEPLTTATVEDWIRNPQSVFAEAGGRRRHGDGRYDAEDQIVAQCQFRTPHPDLADGWKPPRLVPGHDEIWDEVLHRKIEEDGPHATGVIDFLGVLPSHAHLKFAAARYEGFMEVIRRNRSLPPNKRVKQMAGVAFAIQGLEVPDNAHGMRQILLSQFREGEIANKISLLVNAGGRQGRCPARLIGKTKTSQKIPVKIRGVDCNLLAQWYYCAHFLDEVVLPGGSVLTDEYVLEGKDQE